jgi:large conductance mechanosensitive channel
MEGFKKFILRGNVIDLAVGIAVGAAFTTVVNALVKDFITPLVGAFFKTPDFSTWVFYVNGSKFAIGDFINSVVSFALLAAAVYFIIVLPMNKLVERMKARKPVDPTDKKCTECLSTIPIAAKRCSFCGQPQTQGATLA